VLRGGGGLFEGSCMVVEVRSCWVLGLRVGVELISESFGGGLEHMCMSLR
jgi:hypothetical protein